MNAKNSIAPKQLQNWGYGLVHNIVQTNTLKSEHAIKICFVKFEGGAGMNVNAKQVPYGLLC
jgi:hypothetical protein